MDVTAASDGTDSGSTDQDLVGIVVEALAMTRASSMDVESIRKIVVVCLNFSFPKSSLTYLAIGLYILPIGDSTVVKDRAHQRTAEANPPRGSRLWSQS